MLNTHEANYPSWAETSRVKQPEHHLRRGVVQRSWNPIEFNVLACFCGVCVCAWKLVVLSNINTARQNKTIRDKIILKDFCLVLLLWNNHKELRAHKHTYYISVCKILEEKVKRWKQNFNDLACSRLNFLHK